MIKYPAAVTCSETEFPPGSSIGQDRLHNISQNIEVGVELFVRGVDLGYFTEASIAASGRDSHPGSTGVAYVASLMQCYDRRRTGSRV